MIKFQLAILAFIIFIGSVHADIIENSISGETRISLDGTWNFKADYNNNGEDQAWFAGNFNDSDWDKMNVPGNWDIRNEYANYTGKGWYRTAFETPPGIDGKVVRLNFEAVGIDYKVWLNGEQIANVTGGYFPKFLNISGKLKSGAKNTLVVCADNTFRSGAYWSWGGIRRPVTLIVNNRVFVESAHIVSIPDLKKGTASVSVSTILFNGSKTKEPVSLEYELSFGGKVIKKGSTTVMLTGDANQIAGFEFPLAKKQVKLWHFDFPNLYTLNLQLKMGNVVVHATRARFGIRKAEIVNGEFLLNGEPVRAMGMNWVADDRLTGNTLPAEVYRRDIDNMKSLGVTITRLSHLPLPKEVYDYLDEKGMLIIAEIPLWGTTNLTDPANPIAREWIKQLVNNHFNHPSIIGWCVGNEISDKIRNPKVMEYAEKAIKFVKDSLDNSRIVVLVSHTANHQKEDPSQFGDFVPYNTYGSWGKNVDNVHEYQPGKMIFISECGSSLIGEDLNTSTGNFSKMINEFRGRKYLFGASLWTYNDYRSFHRSSDPTWDSKVSQNRDWGVADGYGNKKRAYQVIRKEFAPLKSFVVKANGISLEVSMQSREKLDLPAYNLRDYKLVCEEFGKNNKLLKKTENILPLIKPGDPLLVKTFAITGNPSVRKISLISPTDYIMMDTTICYVAPEKPVIKEVFNTGDKIRVLFGHVAWAIEYKLLYGDQDLNKETVPTIDHFIEIQNFTGMTSNSRKVKIQLVAVNGFGESKSEIHTETLDGFAVFPPVIKGIRAFQNGISIGYSSNKSEYLYKVQFSTSPNFSTDTHILQTTSRASCHIPGLKSGVTYYVRMCTVEQYDLQSPWSETWTVKLPFIN